ncbi:MAG: LysE family translocator [Marinicella sp.]
MIKSASPLSITYSGLHLPEALISLIIATALLLGTPGPATLGLAAVGSAYGFRTGLPFLAGIIIGLCVVIMGSILGLSTLFSAFPNLRTSIQILGALYIIYVAFKIASAPVISANNDDNQMAPGFSDGFIFNLLNPKAYAAFFALFSQFLLPISPPLMAYVITSLVCFTVAVIVDVIWLFLGELIRPLFTRPLSAKILRIGFAMLMVAAVTWAFFQ